MSATLAAYLYRWRIALSLFFALGALLFIPLANVTQIDNDITAWFSRQDPVYQDYERFRREFGGTRTLIVALQTDRLFTAESLAFVREITAEIERVPLVQRVESLATATIVTALPAGGGENADEGGLEVKSLLGRSGPIDPEQARARALGDPLIRGDLVSEDGTVTAVIVSFDEDRIDEVRGGVIQQIHEIVDPRLPSGMRAHYNGSLEISETYNRVSIANTRNFTPPMMLVTLLAIYGMFRSLRKTVLTGLAIVISVLWTLGLYILMGFTYNLLASMLVPLTAILAVADDVHIMQHYGHELRATGSHEQAFKSTLTHLTAPLLGASATTALGMLSLATSDVVAVRTFGIGAAVGVMVDFVMSIVLVPTLLGLVKPDPVPPPQESYLVGPMRRVARFATERPGVVMTVTGLVAVIASFGIFRLRVDTNHINFFSRDHPLTRSADVIDRQLSGIYSFQILLEGPPDSMKDPGVLRRIDALQQQLARLPYVRKVRSVVDYVKRVNRELNDGDAKAAVVPASAELVAQELFVFSMADEGRRELERVVSSDFSRAQIAVKLASMSSDLVFAQIHEAERLAQRAFAGTGIEPTVTGSGRLFSALDHYLVASQISSFGTAFLTVFGVIFLIFRSVRFGLLAIVANFVPVIAVLGTMGWLNISLNIATVMLASVALGVVDDDTIHFISRYRRETAAGVGTDRAIEIATIHEGRASLTTALINSCGYAILMLSEYRPTAWFGGMLALTMAVAFLAEVFVVPATIKLSALSVQLLALRKEAADS